MRNPEHLLTSQMRIALPIDQVFSFFAEAGNLERITPPELNFRIVTPTPVAIREGTRIDYRLSLFGVPFQWTSEITLWRPPFEFEDTQRAGPYAQWIHWHAFREEAGGTVIDDLVRYRLPVPGLGEVALPLVKLQLRRIFRYRALRIRELLGDTRSHPAAA